MFDHDPGRPHPSLIDLATRRAAMPDKTTVPSASTRPADPIHLHLRRPRWQPVNVADPESALRSTIAQATHKPTDIGPIYQVGGSDMPTETDRRFVRISASDVGKTNAATADMSGGIGKALEDAEQGGYVRGHADGLVAAVECARADWVAVGGISGFLVGWALFVGWPALIKWLG